MKRSQLLLGVFLAGLCLSSFSAKEPEHDRTEKVPKKNLRRRSNRPPGEDPCLGGRGLAAFANGDDFNMEGMVSFLTEGGCQERQSSTVKEALAQRISFNEEPFRLKQVASNFNPSSVQSIEHANQHLLRFLPLVMRDHPMPKVS